MQGGKAPTAKQKRWHEWLREKGCCNCGQPAAIHHCAGSSAKHNKIHIGQWWTLNLCYNCHQGDDGIHHSMMIFGTNESRKEIEKRLFVKMVAIYEAEFTESPCGSDVIDSILDYRR